MAPTVRLAYDNGAGQSVGDGSSDRGRGPTTARGGTRAVPGTLHVWETGLDKTGLDNFKPPLNT
ncbi:hypothetical protein GCM10010424_00970 [Streptomyces lienomycini]